MDSVEHNGARAIEKLRAELENLFNTRGKQQESIFERID
jgi:hypothetical protein